MLSRINELKILGNDEKAQTSVEVILLIGSILVISIVCGTYIYKINLEINDLYNQTLVKARSHLINKLN